MSIETFGETRAGRNRRILEEPPHPLLSSRAAFTITFRESPPSPDPCNRSTVVEGERVQKGIEPRKTSKVRRRSDGTRFAELEDSVVPGRRSLFQKGPVRGERGASAPCFEGRVDLTGG